MNKNLESSTRLGAISIRNTAPFDVWGNPTISVPCGFTRQGLPIGLQISGPNGGEATVLQLARAYEQATDWHTRRALGETRLSSELFGLSRNGTRLSEDSR